MVDLEFGQCASNNDTLEVAEIHKLLITIVVVLKTKFPHPISKQDIIRTDWWHLGQISQSEGRFLVAPPVYVISLKFSFFTRYLG